MKIINTSNLELVMSIITVTDISFEIISASIDWRFDLLVSRQENVVQSKQI